MKLSASKALGVAAIALSLAVLPGKMPASAQTGTGTGADTTTTSPDTTTTTTDTYAAEDDGFDWGWLGLLGLLGLAGLARKPATTATAYREPDEVSRPGSRF